MDLTAISAAAVMFILGATSPGPSLAVVLREAAAPAVTGVEHAGGGAIDTEAAVVVDGPVARDVECAHIGGTDLGEGRQAAQECAGSHQGSGLHQGLDHDRGGGERKSSSVWPGFP